MLPLLNSISALAPVGTAIGQVHSVYRATVNFTLQGRLFSLQSHDALASPISFSLAAGVPLPKARPSESVRWDNGFLQVSSFVFDARSAQKPSCRLHPSKIRLDPQAASAIGNASASGFAGVITGQCTPSNPWEQEAHRLLVPAKDALNRCDAFGFAAAACEFIGLGLGLTPSGDDWLCGVLAALQALSLRPFVVALREQLPSYLSKTNDISGRFLEVSAAGHFSRPLRDLFVALEEGNLSATQIAVNKLRGLGHTSGADLLSGILFVLTYHNDIPRLGEII